MSKVKCPHHLLKWRWNMSGFTYFDYAVKFSASLSRSKDIYIFRQHWSDNTLNDWKTFSFHKAQKQRNLHNENKSLLSWEWSARWQENGGVKSGITKVRNSEHRDSRTSKVLVLLFLFHDETTPHIARYPPTPPTHSVYPWPAHWQHQQGVNPS
jgi:hypothetical protein